MKVIDYIELLSYGEYDYYDTKFSINNTGIKGNFTMNDFCQRLALTEEVLNMEIEIMEDKQKENKKIEKLDLSDWWEITSSEDCKPEMLAKIFNKNAKAFSSKINEIIDYINKENK
jgi:hypothetical protein